MTINTANVSHDEPLGLSKPYPPIEAQLDIRKALQWLDQQAKPANLVPPSSVVKHIARHALARITLLEAEIELLRDGRAVFDKDARFDEKAHAPT